MRMKNLLNHAMESLLIHGVERKEGHHHIFEIARTHTTKDCLQECK
jgi:hypothetical protein